MRLEHMFLSALSNLNIRMCLYQLYVVSLLVLTAVYTLGALASIGC
jgi:hypothetical protein